MMIDFSLPEAGQSDRPPRKGSTWRAMIPDPLTTGRLFWTARRFSTRTQIERSDKDKLSWRLSLLIILALSLALWGALWAGAEALLQSRW